MELDEFIKTTLLQIVSSVKEAQDELGDDIINPRVSDGFTATPVIKKVSFDVAVTTEDKLNAGGKAKISVLGASLGGGVNSENLSKIATRIKFEVPVKYTNSEEDLL